MHFLDIVLNDRIIVGFRCKSSLIPLTDLDPYSWSDWIRSKIKTWMHNPGTTEQHLYICYIYIELAFTQSPFFQNHPYEQGVSIIEMLQKHLAYECTQGYQYWEGCVFFSIYFRYLMNHSENIQRFEALIVLFKSYAISIYQQVPQQLGLL